MRSQPAVTIAIPVLNEERHIEACLDAIAQQTYEQIREVLVVDGGSTDRTRELAQRHRRVRVLDNPRRIQAAALNIALHAAEGEVVVRVDGHCVISASTSRGASTPSSKRARRWSEDRWSRKRRRQPSTGSLRLCGRGSVLDPHGSTPGARLAGSTRCTSDASERRSLVRSAATRRPWASTKTPSSPTGCRRVAGSGLTRRFNRSTSPVMISRALARQFWRYGLSRAATAKRHPRSMRLRQLAGPALVLGVLSPWRRHVAATYGAIVLARTAVEARRGAAAALTFGAALPVMHFCWGAGFIAGIVGASPPQPFRDR